MHVTEGELELCNQASFNIQKTFVSSVIDNVCIVIRPSIIEQAISPTPLHVQLRMPCPSLVQQVNDAPQNAGRPREAVEIATKGQVAAQEDRQQDATPPVTASRKRSRSGDDSCDGSAATLARCFSLLSYDSMQELPCKAVYGATSPGT